MNRVKEMSRSALLLHVHLSIEGFALAFELSTERRLKSFSRSVAVRSVTLFSTLRFFACQLH